MHRVPRTIAVILLLLGGMATSCQGAPEPSPRGGSPAQAGSDHAATSQTPADTGAPPPTKCHVTQTRLAVVLAESTMSQPVADIAVTNTGTKACALKGYPQLKAWGNEGFKAPDRAFPLGIHTHHGVYERANNEPRRVLIEPGESAFFSVGTGTAYQGGREMFTISRLAVTLPGTHLARAVRLHLLATSPRERPFPVGITPLRSVQK